MGDSVLLASKECEEFGLDGEEEEEEEELDAFNLETFGGEGDKWEESGATLKYFFSKRIFCVCNTVPVPLRFRSAVLVGHQYSEN
jgi:hypothetical protein